MLFAQFFTRSTGYVPGTIPPRFDGPRELIEACGDRGVLIVDARVRASTASALARDHAKRYGFEAFQLHRGATFTHSKPCGNAEHVPVENSNE